MKPLFPFGFGLSYTTFTYANLAVKDQSTNTAHKYVISFDITNSGNRAGAEVAEVYVASSDPTVPRPAKELKGFVKINLNPGERQHVTVPLDTRSFAYFDTNQGVWAAPAGKYEVLVGTSSEEIKVSGGITLSRTLTEKP